MLVEVEEVLVEVLVLAVGGIMVEVMLEEV
jgi:hypothetical protein